jgi:hypothetical protein
MSQHSRNAKIEGKRLMRGRGRFGPIIKAKFELDVDHEDSFIIVDAGKKDKKGQET